MAHSINNQSPADMQDIADHSHDSVVPQFRLFQLQPAARPDNEEKLAPDGEKRYTARRWVVERTLAWLSKCRAILVRYDKCCSRRMRS